jgi:hypothetical protein
MAKGQLSIGFGHFSLPFIPEYAMDRTFEALEPSLGFYHLEVNRGSGRRTAVDKADNRPVVLL